MIKDILQGDAGCLQRRGFGFLDQPGGLGRRQFGGLVVNEAGNRSVWRQKFNPATDQHLESAGLSRNRNQSGPTGVQPESERGG
jgi:hypothetical protein